MASRTTSLLVAALVLTGCSGVGGPWDPQPVEADLVVVNRTLDEVTYIASDGGRLVVPPCGRAAAPDFRLDNVHVRGPAGFVRGFGSGQQELHGALVHLIETTPAHSSGMPAIGPPPAELPPCDGHLEVEPGH